jgi:hypothetical protein
VTGVRLGAAAACLVVLALGFSPEDCRAWDEDIVVSAQSDSVEIVALAADPDLTDTLYALLARSASQTVPPAPDEIALSWDGGSTWSPLCHPVPSRWGRGGIDMVLAESSLCLVETRCDSACSRLIACQYDAETGELLYTTVVQDDLVSGADVSLACGHPEGQPYTYVYLAAIIDRDGGPLLFFARSPNGGVSWFDEIVLGVGDLGRIDLTSAPGTDGHLLLSYIESGQVYLALNVDCGHSEYWADVYSYIGPAAAGSRPTVAAQGSLAVLAWELPEGDVAYCCSQDAGCTWELSGLLAASEHRESAPAVAAEACGRFHLLYTDATVPRVFHRYSWSPVEIGSWSTPETVSDGSVWFAPEASDLQAVEGSANAVGALFVAPTDRVVCFDSERLPGAAVDAMGREVAAGATAGGGGAARGIHAHLSLRCASPSPGPPPFELIAGAASLSRFQAGAGIYLEILDINGRLLRCMPVTGSVSTASELGFQQTTVWWDGMDGWQRGVPPGVYVARLRAALPEAQEVLSAKCRILLIR